MKNDCVNGEGSKVLMANFKILWIHVLYLVYGFIFRNYIPRNKTLLRHAIKRRRKLKKVLSFDILFCENRHFPVNKKLLTSELSSLLIS